MKPKIAVLMATYNGADWILSQVESILNQRGVDVKLIVSDDCSTDNTVALIQSVYKNDPRVTILPFKTKFGLAAKNFYHLIIYADISDCDYVALSDQDDIWLRNKLHKMTEISATNIADGVSSNVVAFWPNGDLALIDKSSPLKRLDFLFEAAGPGNTYLLSPWLINKIKDILLDPTLNATEVRSHDWLIYAVCRAYERTWYISPAPTVKYRQHDNNELGVNLGAEANWKRLKKLLNGWYKTEVMKICIIVSQITPNTNIRKSCENIATIGKYNRFKFLTLVNQSRRSARDRLILIIAILFNIF